MPIIEIVRLPGFESEDEAIAWCHARGFRHPMLYRGVDGTVRGSVRVLHDAEVQATVATRRSVGA